MEIADCRHFQCSLVTLVMPRQSGDPTRGRGSRHRGRGRGRRGASRGGLRGSETDRPELIDSPEQESEGEGDEGASVHQ